jgi:hypothetical protein
MTEEPITRDRYAIEKDIANLGLRIAPLCSGLGSGVHPEHVGDVQRRRQGEGGSNPLGGFARRFAPVTLYLGRVGMPFGVALFDELPRLRVPRNLHALRFRCGFLACHAFEFSRQRGQLTARAYAGTRSMFCAGICGVPAAASV